MALDMAPAPASAVLGQLQAPGQLQASNLVPALRDVILSLQPARQQGSWTLEGALLACPLVVGLLGSASQLLEEPRAAAALGPEAPLLLLEALSHLAATGLLEPGSDAAHQAEHCRALWRRAQAAVGDAADAAGTWSLRSPSLMGPDQIVRYYEACARGASVAGTPTKSSGLGLLLKHHLHNRRFSDDECVRLLAAWAHLRGRMPFNPDTYNFAQLEAALSAGVSGLSSAQLQAVATAAPAFPWPVYRSMPLLHAVCREAMQRSVADSMSPPAVQRTLAAAFRGAAANRPRLAQELQATTWEHLWAAQPAPTHQLANIVPTATQLYDNTPLPPTGHWTPTP